MAKLVDVNGEEAAVGKSTGYWLNEEDIVSTAGADPQDLGAIGFPRDWPAVYTTSKALKSLIGKKGQCAGKKVGVVGLPLPEEAAQVKGVTFYPLQSFSNAEKVEKAAGLPVVRGWAVFEHLDKQMSAAFVAERHWWNVMPDGKWVDFSPRPKAWVEILLAEAAADEKRIKSKINAAESRLAQILLKQRGYRAPKSKPVTTPEPKPAEPIQTIDPAKKAASKVPSSISELVKRLHNGDVAALKDLEERSRGNEELCVQIVNDGAAVPIVKMLQDDSKSEDALKLVMQLTDGGVGQKSVEVQHNFITAGAIAPLVKLLSTGNTQMQELAAAVLGNLCHESPVNQDKIARLGAFKPLIELLDKDVGPAQEAAYAIWNLTVGNEENSAKVVRAGAVPKLTDLLQCSSDIAQENAAGALMHVTMSEEARTAIVQANAIPRLCELLSSKYEPEVSSQAAGTLLNLANDCPEHSKEIVKHGAIKPLLALVKDAPDLAREYAAGALMNLIRGAPEVADKVVKEGAIPILASVLSKPVGHSEALGALANLASGSADRQIAIYKGQVTRKTVALLSDPDVDVRRSAAALLMNLAPHAKIKERILEAGALKPLGAVLKDPDDAVKERAAGALANLFNDHSANVHAGFEQARDMIPSLIAILQGQGLTEDAKRQAAHALAMLAAEDGPCDAVWSAGAGTPLLQLLKHMIAEAALAIMNLSWRWPEVKKELAKAGALESLARMLMVGEPMAKEYAAGALMNMTAGSKENAERAVGTVTSLVELLKADGIQAAEWAAGALANVIRAGESAQRAAADAGAASYLANLLPKVTNNGKTLVILALTSLAETQAQSVQKALGPKEKAKLREFRDSGNDELQDYTNTLVDTIRNGFAL